MPIHEDHNGWILETAASAYALGLNAAGILAHRYWGPRLPYPGDYPPAPHSEGWVSLPGAGSTSSTCAVSR
jgi:hypothetical protein